IATLAVQLICFKSSSSTSVQQGSVVIRFALPPAARRISSEPQPISVATSITASSSPISPSSSAVTHTSPMPSVCSIWASSSLMRWPLASSFLPPNRNIVQNRILPAACFTSMLKARIPTPYHPGCSRVLLLNLLLAIICRHLFEIEHTPGSLVPVTFVLDTPVVWCWLIPRH